MMLTLLDLELGVWVRLHDGNSVLVRRFRRSDADALYEFFTWGLSPETQRLYSTQPLDRHLVDTAINEADAPNVMRLVALENNHIIGCACWREQTSKPFIPLLSIAVADNYQGLGLGRALMELLIDAAKLKGMSGIELHVFKHNERAISLYRKLGFQIVGDTDYERQWVMVL